MKVVLKTIMQLVDEAIEDNTAERIIRIELTNTEFTNFLGSYLRENNIPSTVNKSKGTYHGSYLLYRGVCVQCCEDERSRVTVTHP